MQEPLTELCKAVKGLWFSPNKSANNNDKLNEDIENRDRQQMQTMPTV
jgi:hypothetical protein